MKQWFMFIFSFLSFLAVFLIILILVLGNKSFSDAEQKAIDRVKSENLLEEVERAYVYSNKQTSVTVLGADAEGELKAVFVPAGKNEITETKLEDKISAQEARGIALEDMDVKEILHTKLGMDSEGPVWEVAFLNSSERLNYVYVKAGDGTVWKRILNL